MKKLFLVISCLCILLCGCNNDQSLSDDPVTRDTFAFNKDKYPIITDCPAGDAMYIPDIDTLEKVMMERMDGAELGIIAECTVVGESINWVVSPSLGEQETAVTYEANHVLTPVRIDKILYAGTTVNIPVGTEMLLIEPYFYITDETPDYQKQYNTREISACVGDYNPVVKGNRYVMFLRMADYYTELDFAYPAEEGTLFFQPVYRQLSIYGIGSKDAVAQDLVTVSPDFWSSWEQVMDVYVNSKVDEPFTKPQIYTGELSK